MSPQILELVRTDNGYAVYDISVASYMMTHDRKPFPIAVFETKEALLRWLNNNWLPKSVFDK